MAPTRHQQICISCNKKNSLRTKVCKCGHVLKDGIPFKEERSLRRNRAIHPSVLLPSNQSKAVKEPQNKSEENQNKITKPKPQKLQKRRKFNLSKIPARIKTIEKALGDFEISQNAKYNNDIAKDIGMTTINNKDLDEQVKLSLINDLKKFNILQDIKNSPKNSYFHKSKKYRPAKYHELDFEFDFSTFNSNSPFYPNALDDINEKISRHSNFWNAIF